MRITLIFLALLSNLLTNVTLGQNATDVWEQEAAITALVAKYLETRAENDEQGLLTLLTEDVDQLTTTGNLRSGIDAVSSGSLATTNSNPGTSTISIESIRFIRPDVAIVDGPYDIVDRVGAPDRHYLASIIVVMEDGEWLITAIRNMQPRQ